MTVPGYCSEFAFVRRFRPFLLDILDGSTDIPDLNKVKVVKSQLKVDKFASQMCLFFSKEDDRRNTALPLLNSIFAARSGLKISQILAIAVCSSMMSDGQSCLEDGAKADILSGFDCCRSVYELLCFVFIRIGHISRPR
jgi:hypothetical protein